MKWKKAYVVQKIVERPKQIEIVNRVLNMMIAFAVSMIETREW